MNVASRRIFIGCGVIGLMIYAAFSITGSFAASKRLAQEQSDLAELREKLSEIQRWSAAPRVAALNVESPDQILNRISQALKAAGLPTQALTNQTPAEPQRLQQSEFQLRKVEITLGRATVSQIVRFCEALRDESTGSVVRDLQLYNPETQNSRETWISKMTLTQVIFSPKSDS
ncbi:MAG: hypothetical protein AAGJ83_06200 [Planctomycetota bacterium]